MFTSNKKSLFQLQTQALHICKAKWGTQRTTGPVASVFHKYFMIAKRCRPKQWLLGCEDVQSSGALRGLGLTLKCSIKFEYCLLLLFILNTIVNSVLNLNLCIYHKCQVFTEYIFQSPRKHSLTRSCLGHWALVQWLWNPSTLNIFGVSLWFAVWPNCSLIAKVHCQVLGWTKTRAWAWTGLCRVLELSA